MSQHEKLWHSLGMIPQINISSPGSKTDELVFVQKAWWTLLEHKQKCKLVVLRRINESRGTSASYLKKNTH